MQICGSYRRGRTHCGDIDILFSHPNDELRKSFLKAVLDKLKEDGIITDDLICVQSEEQRKYMGVCKLPGENTKVSTILQLLNYNSRISLRKKRLIHVQSHVRLADTRTVSSNLRCLPSGEILQGFS